MSAPEPLASWLRRHKVFNGLELDLMALQFDLEGALADGQQGLAWISQERMLHTAILLYVGARGYTVPADRDRADSLRLAIAEMDRWNPPLADRTWELVLRSPSLSDEGIARAIHETAAFVTADLGIPSGASRAEATRVWAEGVGELRAAAAKAGLADSDSWYLPNPTGGSSQADWFADVMSTLTHR